MSDNQTNASSPTTPMRPLGRGRVRALSQHFETMVQEQEERLAKRTKRDPEDVASRLVEIRAKLNESPVEPTREGQMTILTGEFRTPLRDRLRLVHEDIKAKARLRRENATLSAQSTGNGDLPANPPSTPVFATFPEGECPGAPVKAEKFTDALARRLSSSSEEDDINDHLFDRKAKPHTAEKKRSFLDISNERRQKGDITPSAPSPLRRSFFGSDESDDELL